MTWLIAGGFYLAVVLIVITFGRSARRGDDERLGDADESEVRDG